MHYKNEVIKKNSNVLRTLVLALNNSCRKNFLKIGLKLKTTFQIALDKNIQTLNQRKTIVNLWEGCLENDQMVINSGFPTVNCRK